MNVVRSCRPARGAQRRSLCDATVAERTRAALPRPIHKPRGTQIVAQGCFAGEGELNQCSEQLFKTVDETITPDFCYRSFELVSHQRRHLSAVRLDIAHLPPLTCFRNRDSTAKPCKQQSRIKRDSAPLGVKLFSRCEEEGIAACKATGKSAKIIVDALRLAKLGNKIEYL
jgi:hypothetical protein